MKIFVAYLLIDKSGKQGFGNCEIDFKIKSMEDIREIENKISDNGKYKVSVTGWQKFK